MGITPLEWFKTENPLLGGVSPIHMIKAGREEKLCKFILNSIELEELPSEEVDILKDARLAQMAAQAQTVKCPSDKCTCDYCTDDRQEISTLPETKETLEEILCKKFNEWRYGEIITCSSAIAQIALDHFKENPEELELELTEYMVKARMNMVGLVSHKKVMEVFDIAVTKGESTRPWEDYTGDLRKALEKLRRVM